MANTDRTRRVEEAIAHKYGYEDGNVGDTSTPEVPADLADHQKKAYEEGFKEGLADRRDWERPS